MALRLVDTSIALQAAGMSSQGDNPTGMEKALEASAPILENLIGSPFTASDRKDWFNYLPSPLQREFRPIKLFTSQAFIDIEVPFTLYKSNTVSSVSGKPLPIASDKSNATELLFGEDFVIDHDRGVIDLLSDVPAGHSTLLFEYCAGFAVDDTGLADQRQVPNWLKQAQIAGGQRWALAIQHKWNNRERVDLTPEVVAIFRQHINEKIRPRYGTYPARTLVC